MNTDSEIRQTVTIGPKSLEGFLNVPRNAAGLVIFAHGSGSSRLSPRNNFVAERLRAHGLGTLLFDLLTAEEGAIRANVFDISLLGRRVAEAVGWACDQAALRDLPIGLFGSSTGAAAALVGAAQMPDDVAAVVSRGGRPDLAGTLLAKVQAPTLLIVGGSDTVVIALNEEAFAVLTCEKKLHIVPGATHLFEEPGTLEQVVEATAGWFRTHFERRSA